MKKFLHSLSECFLSIPGFLCALPVWKKILGITGILSLIAGLIFLGIADGFAEGQSSQQMAARWSSEGGTAQVSCFFSQSANVTHDKLESFRHAIDSALQEASIVQDSSNPSARLWVDAFSAGGQIRVSSDRASITADAVGVGGDFFLFHPLKLLDGNYFAESDLNSDYCILDEDGAWQLFGSNDVAGMTVMIGDRQHIVAGVVHRDRGRLETAAGLDSAVVYVSYDTLHQYGTDYGINHYEIVMPNPVKNYAYKYVMEHIGVNAEDRDVVENSSRYNLKNRFEVLASFGTRSMNGKAIIYPYWENIARGYEDIIALITLFALLFISYPLITAVIFLILAWKHKSWTVKSIYLSLKDKGERRIEKLREERKRRRKHKKEYKNKFDDEEEYK